jgi:hypothetical protein
VGDADGLEELGAGRVVVAAEEEELGENLGGERRVVRPRPRRRGRWAVAANAADLSLLVFVIVSADPARVLPLPLPHLRCRRSPIERSEGLATRPIESAGTGRARRFLSLKRKELGADWIGWGRRSEEAEDDVRSEHRDRRQI